MRTRSGASPYREEDFAQLDGGRLRRGESSESVADDKISVPRRVCALRLTRCETGNLDFLKAMNDSWYHYVTKTQKARGIP